jgi:azurin
MKKMFLFTATASLALAIACGSPSEATDETTTNTTNTETAATIEATGEAVELTLEGNDMMKFDINEFTVNAGDKVVLHFKNVGELPIESMGHNVVVLKPGTDLASFAGEAIKAADKEYIPLTFQSSIIAHTKLLGPGQEDTIEFVLDTPGEYPYICSFPGHYGLMQGKIIAK